MAQLHITPYAPIIGKKFYDPIEVVVTTEILNGHSYKPKTPLITFTGCLINNVRIKCPEKIHRFQTFEILFVDCFVGKMFLDEIVGNNFLFKFSQCVIEQADLYNNGSFAVIANNCITESLTIYNAVSAEISILTENHDPVRWSALANKIELYSNFRQYFSYEQVIEIINTKSVRISGSKDQGEPTGYYDIPPPDVRANTQRYRLTEEERAAMDFHVTLKYTPDMPHMETNVYDLRLNSLSFEGATAGKIKVEDCRIKQLHLNNFHPKEEFSLYYISAPKMEPSLQPDAGDDTGTKMEIRNCTLDNGWFDNVDFDSYQAISLYKTKFSKTTFSACNFPSDYSKFQSLENIHDPASRRDNYHKDMYEIFLQLRKALESTGNFHESINLHSVSNDALREIRGLSRWDKFILWVNKVSNNHGISIQRALAGFILSSITVYLFYLLSLGRLFNGNSFDPSLIGYYFAFIDITHRNDFLVPKEDFGGFTLLIDFIGKLLVGFFIYQFIAAFRKYGRK